METPGEDPYLTSQYLVNYVKGVQEGEDPRYLKAIATPKHFAGYSLEKSDRWTRMGFNAVISDSDLVQTYFPVFEAAVKHGGALSFMCRYVEISLLESPKE